ncbi:MAG: HEAT repeat domain-containing protein [Verrucomicrobiota bacterium]
MIRAIVIVLVACVAVAALAVTLNRDVRISELEKELAEVRERVEESVDRVSVVASTAEAPSELDDEIASEVVGPEDEGDVRNGQLESRVAKLEGRTQDFDELHNIMVLRGILPPTPADVEKAKQKVLNTNASEEARVKALETVRRSKTEARTRDIVLSMVELLESDPLPRIQRKIFEGLVGVSDPELIEPIREAIERSQSEFVREQATRALVGYRDDPTIQAWLETIQADASNGNVRGQARRLLEEER